MKVWEKKTFHLYSTLTRLGQVTTRLVKFFDDFDSTQTQSVYDFTNITPTHACYLVMANLSFTFGFKSPRIEALGAAIFAPSVRNDRNVKLPLVNSSRGRRSGIFQTTTTAPKSEHVHRPTNDARWV